MSWFHRPGPSLEELDPPQVSAHLETSPGILVDVREPNEWAAGHAAGAVHIPLGRLASRAAELPADVPVYLICAHGNRSKVAAQLLQRAGFARPVNVRGGTAAWMRAGLPMARD
jgi:rhodanese-related sulfurtransferase